MFLGHLYSLLIDDKEDEEKSKICENYHFLQELYNLAKTTSKLQDQQARLSSTIKLITRVITNIKDSKILVNFSNKIIGILFPVLGRHTKDDLL